MIRPAEVADVEGLTTLEDACFGADAWSERLVGAELAQVTRTVLVVAAAHGLEAYGSISVTGDTADLMRIVVRPDARRRGVARELLAELRLRASQRGAGRMLLEVGEGNVAAIALYETAGFTTISRRAGYNRDGTDSLVMQATLQEEAAAPLAAEG